MANKNEITLVTHGAVTLLDIKGDVTTDSDSFLKDAYQNVTDQGMGKILLKFDHEAYINSGGIAVLIQLLAETKRNNQEIGITGLSDHFSKVFNMVGITKFAKIYGNVEEGLQGLAAS
jgi:anti-anti-sigma factor